MTVKQLSVFIENRPGRLSAVTKILGDNDVNIRAMSLADTKDFGILRLIVDDFEKAVSARYRRRRDRICGTSYPFGNRRRESITGNADGKICQGMHQYGRRSDRKTNRYCIIILQPSDESYPLYGGKSLER